jgi:thiamine-monophosphate kinase
MSEPDGERGQAQGGGEDAMIARWFRPLASMFPGAFDLRDDAAVIAPPDGADLVVTTDALIAGVHFFADDAPADIAFKALAVNVSDLAAKAALPLAYSLALALPRATAADWLQGFADGLRTAQEDFGIALSGGDTTVSPSGPLTIAVTAFGTVPRGGAVRRGAAGAGDSLYVSGTIGDAALGLVLRGGDAGTAGWPLGLEDRAWLTDRYLRPRPRLALRDALLAHASAAMDVSDGLVIDGGRMCAASGMDAVIEADKVPLSSAAQIVLNARPDLFETLITGGDDYEILAAVPADEETRFETAASAAGVAVTRIGRFFEGTGRLTVLGADGRELVLTRSGYDHFER